MEIRDSDGSLWTTALPVAPYTGIYTGLENYGPLYLLEGVYHPAEYRIAFRSEGPDADSIQWYDMLSRSGFPVFTLKFWHEVRLFDLEGKALPMPSDLMNQGGPGGGLTRHGWMLGGAWIGPKLAYPVEETRWVPDLGRPPMTAEEMAAVGMIYDPNNPQYHVKEETYTRLRGMQDYWIQQWLKDPTLNYEQEEAKAGATREGNATLEYLYSGTTPEGGEVPGYPVPKPIVNPNIPIAIQPNAEPGKMSEGLWTQLPELTKWDVPLENVPTGLVLEEVARRTNTPIADVPELFREEEAARRGAETGVETQKKRNILLLVGGAIVFLLTLGKVKL